MTTKLPTNPQAWTTLLTGCGVKAATAQAWAPVFNSVVTESTFSAGVNELDDFIGQVLHESAMLERLEENLNYSVEGLLSKFGRHRISEADARRFGRTATQAANRKAIANCLYGGQWGRTNLGNVSPDDGWAYRGSGPIQVTGLSNFTNLQRITGLPLVTNPDLLRKSCPEALRVCIAWWEGNVPDSIMGNVTKVTKRVNGGNLGLAHRAELTDKANQGLA